MAKEVIFRCDGCGVPRKESNHWWSAEPTNPTRVPGTRLLIGPFADCDGAQHYCGEACLIKRVSEFTAKDPIQHVASVSCCCSKCMSGRMNLSGVAPKGAI